MGEGRRYFWTQFAVQAAWSVTLTALFCWLTAADWKFMTGLAAGFLWGMFLYRREIMRGASHD